METEFFLETVKLTPAEQKRRVEIETKIFETVRQSYITIGELLCEIGEKGLYKSTHRDFDDYCRDVLDMAARTANQHVQAFEVARNIASFIADLPEEKRLAIESFRKGQLTNQRNCADFGGAKNTQQGTGASPQLLLPLLPANEGQARALFGLTPEEQREVWLKSLESAPEGKVTAAHVRATVRSLKGGKITETISRAKRAKAPNSSRIGEEFNAAFTAFLAAVQAEVDSGWATTDRVSVVRHLDGIRAAISLNGNHKIAGAGCRIEASNVEKLVDAGFVIYRMLPAKLIIERMIAHNKWEIVGETYPDVETLTEAFDELMLDQNNLRA